MVMGLAAMVSASTTDNWFIYIQASTALGGAPYLAIGTKAGASAGYVEGEDTTGLAPMAGQAGVAATIVGYSNVNQDVRPGAATGSTTWNFKVTVPAPDINGDGTAYADTPVTLTAWNVNFDAISGPGTTIKLMNGSSTLWTFTPGALGTAANPNYTTTISFTDPNGDVAGVGTGYSQSLKLVATYSVVSTPEPGSMVAMLSGLIGLVGYGIRRRK